MGCDNNGKAITNPVIVSDYILDTQTIEYDCDITITDVSDIVSSDTNEGQRYNISGQKVSDDYRGVVIVNGEKKLNK